MNVKTKITKNDLPKLSLKMRGKAARLLNRGAETVEAFAKFLVPIDTGNLQSKISQTKRATVFNLAAETTADAEYAGVVEFGSTRQAAQPYMTPASERAKKQIAEEVKNLLK